MAPRSSGGRVAKLVMNSGHDENNKTVKCYIPVLVPQDVEGQLVIIPPSEVG
jgi:hypothetical protein